MEKQLAGYYWDAERNRYFPGQATKKQRSCNNEETFTTQRCQFPKSATLTTAIFSSDEIAQQIWPDDQQGESQYICYLPKRKEIRCIDNLATNNVLSISHSSSFDAEAYTFLQIDDQNFILASQKQCSFISLAESDEPRVDVQCEKKDLFACTYHKANREILLSSGNAIYSLKIGSKPALVGCSRGKSAILSIEPLHNANSTVLLGRRNGEISLADCRSNQTALPQFKVPNCAINMLKLLDESGDSLLLTGTTSDKLFLWDLRFCSMTNQQPLVEYKHFDDLAWSQNVVTRTFVEQINGARNSFWASRNNGRVIARYEEAVCVARTEAEEREGKIVASGSSIGECIFLFGQ